MSGYQRERRLCLEAHTRVRSPLVSVPPQFVLYVVPSIYSVSDTKPRSTHRADAQHARSATAVAVHRTGVSHKHVAFKN
eukprot:6214837-Pleurochrysis_carterae.AAC.9